MLKQSCKVSIIIPIYNTEPFLQECFDSVLAQTYKDFEVLLIDDGSTDNSSQICDIYVNLDPRFRKYRKSNGGLSSARNYGLKWAKGDYVIFLDADDFWCDRTFLEKMVDVALATNADIVRGELKEVNINGEDILGYKVPASRIAYSEQILNSADFLEHIMCQDFFVVLSLYKRQIISNIYFDETHNYQEDIEFHIRLFLNDLRCVYTPICFYAYRKRAGSLTTEINVNKLKFSFLLADIYYKYSIITSNNKVRSLYQEKSIMMYYWTMGTLAEDPYYRQRRYIIQNLRLRSLQLRTRNRVLNNKIWNRATVVSLVSPQLGVVLLRFKNYVSALRSRMLQKDSVEQ